jgi:hypothetical protein
LRPSGASINPSKITACPSENRGDPTDLGPFVDGLFWRSPTVFTGSTDRLIGAYLGWDNEKVWGKVIDALIALSIRPAHPVSGDRVYRYLARFSMAEQDLRWGEYLRKQYATQAIARLRRWMEHIERVSVPEEIAPQLVVVLSLLLTTVLRRDRDLATKALVVIGEQHPKHLFRHALETPRFNDPYVSERMLAAAYGVAMSQWAKPNQRGFRAALVSLARKLHAEMFRPGAPFATHHVLRRDYALGKSFVSR